MTTEKLFLAHVERGVHVLCAWFDHNAFRESWKPEAELFATDQQRAIAEVCAAAGAGLDRDGLLLGLRRARKLDLFRDGSEVLEMVLGPYVPDPHAALELLRESAALRALRTRLQDALRVVESGVVGLSESRNAVSAAMRSTDGASGVKARTVRELIGGAVAQATAETRQPGMRTISKRLDVATGGIRPGVVWVLAAGTSWGKTSFLCALVDRSLREGRRPLIVSAEDPEVLYGQRLLQVRTRVNALRLREGILNYDELRVISAEAQAAENVPVFLNAIGRPVETVAADIRSLCAAEGITDVYVDYVQRLRPGSNQQDRRNEVNYCALLCTDAIKEAGAGGILFSQLTELENGKRRARESEDLHNSAEVLLFGISETEADLDAHGRKTGEQRIIKKLWAEKVKDGPAKFSVELDWDRSAACFVSEYDDPRQTALFAHDQGGNQANDDPYDDD